MLHPVVLCGGSDSRLWPLCRRTLPKQLLQLSSQKSLLEETVSRLRGLSDLAPLVAVCNDEHRFLVAGRLLEAGVEFGPVLLEPAGRGTAPAVALAVLQDDPDALLLVLPCDHVMGDAPAFRACVESARPLAHQGLLVSIGVARPARGGGAIEHDKALDGWDVASKSPLEEPDAPNERLPALESGMASSEILLMPAKAFGDELQQHAPAVLEATLAAFEGAQSDLDFCRPHRAAFESCPPVSLRFPSATPWVAFGLFSSVTRKANPCCTTIH